MQHKSATTTDCIIHGMFCLGYARAAETREKPASVNCSKTITFIF